MVLLNLKHPFLASLSRWEGQKDDLCGRSLVPDQRFDRGGLRCEARKEEVGRAGLEPAKAVPADLQSAPFAARDTDPRTTCAENRPSQGNPWRTALSASQARMNDSLLRADDGN